MKPHIKRNLFIALTISLIIIVTGIRLLYYSNRPKNLNIILITIDALRPDHLGCYGYKRNTSPNIDKLAKEGVLFTQAIAQSSHTPPSIGTILTSTLPPTHLLINWGDSIRFDLSTIASILKSNGYKSIFVSNNPDFSTGLHGFAKNFDIFYDQDENAVTLTNKILEFLREDIKWSSLSRPFFLWIHYMDVHSFSAPPSKSYDKLYINDELYNQRKKLPIVKNSLEGYGYKGIPESLAKPKGGVDNPDYYIAQYDGALRTVDEQIGVLLKKLKQFHLDNKTLIIITADHGEMLGEHDYYFHHGWFLYEPLIKVPLIIKCDKVIPQNKVIDSQINAHLDILPTILDILKIDKIKTLQGRSLLNIILKKNKYYSLYVFVDEGYNLKCIRTNEWKLIYSNDKEGYELYNLKGDPQELNNLFYMENYVEKEKLELLKQKLDDYKQVSSQNKKSEPILDEETKERLKSLGYAQ